MSTARAKQKVFGLGLSKTGTTSLSAALNCLGIKTIHFPHDEKTYHELRSGQYRLSILDEFDGAVDTPVAPYYAQLDSFYPGSKFILTVRDKESWLRSTEHHWATTRESEKQREEFNIFIEFIYAVVYGTVDFNRERFAYVYDTHERNVRHYFKDRPDDLLVLDVCGGEGWEKLCGFLGLDVPPVPFPFENRGIAEILHAAKALEELVEPGRTYVLIDDLLFWEGGPADRHPIRIVEREGHYWGPPLNDETAIQELERLRQVGAGHLVFAWPAFWWLDYYTAFHAHLRANYPIVLTNERIIAFDLRSGG